MLSPSAYLISRGITLMRRLLTHFRASVEGEPTSARRLRRYWPICSTLEERCLLTVSLTPSGPALPLVGSPVTWTATASDVGPAPVYQFSFAKDGGAPQVVRDFSPVNNFVWD